MVAKRRVNRSACLLFAVSRVREQAEQRRPALVDLDPIKINQMFGHSNFPSLMAVYRYGRFICSLQEHRDAIFAKAIGETSCGACPLALAKVSGAQLAEPRGPGSPNEDTRRAGPPRLARLSSRDKSRARPGSARVTNDSPGAPQQA